MCRGSRGKQLMNYDDPSDLHSRRLSCVGSSFLKFFIYHRAYFYFPTYHEGQLTAEVVEVIPKLRKTLEYYSNGRSSYTFIGNKLIEVGAEETYYNLENLFVPAELHYHENEEFQNLDFYYYGFQFPKLEEKIGYTFQNRALFLQAFTKGSHKLASTNGSYQRLEFLGDAVLEYVIVYYLYYHSSTLNCGEINEYRGIFTSNATLASLILKHDLQKHILHGYRYDIKMNHKFSADIFESFIAAVYLDSGMDLDVVWDVVYCLMMEIESFKELESFNQNV